MGICTSTKQKNVKANQKNDPKADGKDKDKPKDDKEGNKNEGEKKDESKKEESNKKLPGEEGEKPDKSFNSMDVKSNDNVENNANENEKTSKFEEIKVTFNNKGNNELVETFKTSEKISVLFKYLEKVNKYAEYDLLYGENGESLLSRMNNSIGSVFSDVDNVELSMFYFGLEISDNLKKEYEINTTLIGAPLFDLGGDIGLLIFHKFEKKFSSLIIKEEKLSKFSHLSSYCNCKNCFFICGGESDENKTNNNINFNPEQFIANFCEIDLFSPSTINDLKPLTQPRAWHSMIFIPTKYIFIVGGNTNKVEIYETEKKTLQVDSEMKEIRNECTLFCMNNSILYAFGGCKYDGTYLKNVEKCNLRRNERKWEMVNFKTSGNANFQDCFYVPVLKNDNNLILFSTNESDNNNYDNLLFDNENEDNPTISNYKSDDKIIYVCPEKIFHPIGEDTYVLIPLIGRCVNYYKIKSDMKLIKEEDLDALKEIID